MNDAADRDVPPLTLGWRLRMAMESAHLKAEDMADMLGVHRGTITRWTHDVGSPPKRIYLERWASLCQVRYEWLAALPPTNARIGRAKWVRRSPQGSAQGVEHTQCVA